MILYSVHSDSLMTASENDDCIYGISKKGTQRFSNLPEIFQIFSIHCNVKSFQFVICQHNLGFFLYTKIIVNNLFF